MNRWTGGRLALTAALAALGLAMTSRDQVGPTRTIVDRPDWGL